MYNVVCKADKRIRVNASLCLGRGIGRGREEGGKSVNILRSAEEKRRREEEEEEEKQEGWMRHAGMEEFGIRMLISPQR